MKKLFSIFIIGLIILIGAILLNLIGSFLDLMNWYDFIENNFKADLFSIIWLFVFYPLGLGSIAYITKKINF